MDAGGWRVSIDRGGTFTDLVASGPDGGVQVRKLPSLAPGDSTLAEERAIRSLLGEDFRASLRQLRVGTTVATNALLQRRGAPTAILVTKGFADCLRIGHQARDDIFALHIRKPPPLHLEAVEADERLDAQGRVLQPLDEQKLRRDLAGLRGRGIEALAISFLHAYRNPAHELRAEACAREMGFAILCCGHRVSPLIKMVERTRTALMDAYVHPALDGYRARLLEELGAGSTLCMQSHGGLARAGEVSAKDTLLSGPAGGLIGALQVAQAAGEGRVISFDMGGTSTDVGHCEGLGEGLAESLELRLNNRIAGVDVRTPMLQIHTVAAGGGSVCRHADGRYQVGPQSAGADPGPACYGHGGPLSLTDCNLVLGRLRADFLPRIFGADGASPLDQEAALQALREQRAPQDGRDERERAEGFVRIGVEHMAQAIAQISTARGIDLRRYCLVAFGGAGGQHACEVAEYLGIPKVLSHPLAGVLSAWGIHCSQERRVQVQSVEVPLQGEEHQPQVLQALQQLREKAAAGLGEDGEAKGRALTYPSAELRYPGSDTGIRVPWGEPAAMRQRFGEIWEQRTGIAPLQHTPVLATLIAEAVLPAEEAEGLRLDAHAGQAAPEGKGGSSGQSPTAVQGEAAQPGPASPPAQGEAAQPAESAQVWWRGGEHSCQVLRRQDCRPGQRLAGPALVLDPWATTFLAPGWTAQVQDGGALLMQREGAGQARSQAQADGRGDAGDPLELELFNNRFMSIAEQMGEELRAFAVSVNIKERLDFSCGVFDADGSLLANAPHMPVHLGSMGASVEAVMRRFRQSWQPGDCYVLNSPWEGGTHLPDITVVMPVWVGGRAQGGAPPSFFVASRGHHADIGGISPGSMPAFSTHIDEEGILIAPQLVRRGNRVLHGELLRIFAQGERPARVPERNLADLHAQIASCVKGEALLQRAIEERGAEATLRVARQARRNAAASVRGALRGLGEGRAEVRLDNGLCIRVHVRPLDADGDGEGGGGTGGAGEERSLLVDFTGSSPMSETNFNAPLPVVRAAVLYVMRTLVDKPIPMNEGCLDPIDLRVPQDCFLAARHPAAVVAGNVETSQAVCDALYAALGVQAAAQGTMNNISWGNDRVQYYETVCGGSGAGPGWDGTEAVQTHMTNSRLTDPEVLEMSQPVLIERFAVRQGSGGGGRHGGGDGTERLYRFTEPVRFCVLANRRQIPPAGLDGGGDGAPGETLVLREGEQDRPLQAADQCDLQAGDRVLLRTPGGGGHGSAG